MLNFSLVWIGCAPWRTKFRGRRRASHTSCLPGKPNTAPTVANNLEGFLLDRIDVPQVPPHLAQDAQRPILQVLREPWQLKKMNLRGTRRDGHPTTIPTAFSEEDPQGQLMEALRAGGPTVAQGYGRFVFEITWGQKGKKQA